MISHLPISQVLAHQGGWDEILLVAGPLAVFGGALMLANKRANEKLAQQAAEAEAADGDDDIGSGDAEAGGGEAGG